MDYQLFPGTPQLFGTVFRLGGRPLYIYAFDRMLKVRAQRGLGGKWKTGEDVFLWWMEDENIPGQLSMEEYLADAEMEE